MSIGTIGPSDMGRKRNYEVGEYKFVFEASDPFGFVTGYCLKTKEALEGQFTDFKSAEIAATKYANNYKPKTKVQ